MCFAFAGSAQDTVYLNNPSFEDFPRHSHPPQGWRDCGFAGESPPDTQPSGDFAVTYPAADGETYMGMVVRDNETWEAVSQRLSKPLKAGQCYEFSLYLARSPYYVSVSRSTERVTNFNQPVKVRVYGGFDYCQKNGFLGETELVRESNWMQYKLKLEASKPYTYLLIEAFYETPTLFPYNGNVLVDNASPLVPISCKKQVPTRPTLKPETRQPSIAELNTPPPAVAPELPRTNPPPAKPAQPKPEPKPEEKTAEAPAPKLETTIAGVKRSEMSAGKIITLDKLYFEADSTNIAKESRAALEEIYNFLQENKDVTIEVGGHTNNLPAAEYCDQLSTARAKAVADYLIRRGISPDRLEYKGYGKNKPVVSNKTAYGRKRNQRVEVKILKMGGKG